MYGTWLAKTLAWGALMVSMTASPVLAQEVVGGNFTLNESARFGETVVGAGQYEFSIEPIGNLQSVGSIQEGVSHLVLVVLRSEKFGTVASLFAMASGSKNASESNELILEPSKNGTLARTLSLERGGLSVDFRWASTKPKSRMVAQQTDLEKNAVVIRSAGNK